jgi:hypothetical protein
MRLNWLMMRLMFGQSRALRVGRVVHPGARHQLARSPRAQKSARAASAILPRDLDRVQSSSVRLFGSSSRYLSIFLVGASYADRLR